jgi:hypothetical protein
MVGFDSSRLFLMGIFERRSVLSQIAKYRSAKGQDWATGSQHYKMHSSWGDKLQQPIAAVQNKQGCFLDGRNF